MSELDMFEQRMRRELSKFQSDKLPTNVRPRKKPEVSRPSKGVEVTLCVRMKKNSFLDERFTTVVEGTISVLEARIEARRRAEQAGWKHVAYTIDYQQV